jgi:dsDNA-binding SOS-regulon protein
MKPLSTVINRADGMTLVVVWELHDGCWEILSIVRLRCAIALTQESPTTRLVFPTGVFPSGVWGGVCKKHSARTNYLKVDSLLLRQEKLLTLLMNSPRQRKESLAEQLSVSVATVRQLLRKLEKDGKIYHRPHPSQNRTKLYYAGTAPTNTQRGTADNPSKSVRSTRLVPPLKVYFVDPRTLQPLNR